jgi:hypothetical protein
MTTGLKNAAGVDFDDLFDPSMTGTKPADTGIRTSDGVDLSQRYAPIEFGSKGPDVGYRLAAGADVSTLWAAYGTASYAVVGLDGKSLRASDGALTQQSQVTATVWLSMSHTGGWTVGGGNSKGSITQPAPTSGTWLASGSAGDYDALFTVIDSGAADRQVTNGAAAWSSLATTRGVTLLLPTVSGNNATTRRAEATVRIRIKRRSTGVIVSDTTFFMEATTSGYL